MDTKRTLTITCSNEQETEYIVPKVSMIYSNEQFLARKAKRRLTRLARFLTGGRLGNRMHSQSAGQELCLTNIARRNEPAYELGEYYSPSYSIQLPTSSCSIQEAVESTVGQARPPSSILPCAERGLPPFWHIPVEKGNSAVSSSQSRRVAFEGGGPCQMGSVAARRRPPPPNKP